MSRRWHWVDRQQRMTVVVYRTPANAAPTHVVVPHTCLLGPAGAILAPFKPTQTENQEKPGRVVPEGFDTVAEQVTQFGTSAVMEARSDALNRLLL